LIYLPENLSTGENSVVRFYFFFSRDFKECQEIKEVLVSELELQYSQSIQVKYFELRDIKD